MALNAASSTDAGSNLAAYVCFTDKSRVVSTEETDNAFLLLNG